MSTIKNFTEKYQRPKLKSLDVLIQGISRGQQEKLLQGFLTHFKPKIFMANHFDNFFLPYDPQQFHFFPFGLHQQTIEWLKKKVPDTKFILPELGKAIEVM